MIIDSLSSNTGGLNISELMTTCFTNVNKAGSTLAANIEGIVNQGTSLDQGELLKMQFQVGQYNAMLEMVSTVSKSLTDMMKTLAQRTS